MKPQMNTDERRCIACVVDACGYSSVFNCVHLWFPILLAGDG